MAVASVLLTAAAPWVPCRASRMYTSVPRAHHRALVDWRVLRLGLAEASVVPLIRGPRVGTGLTDGASEEGKGFGILGFCISMMVVRLISTGVLRSSNNGGCIIASLPDLAEIACGVALQMISRLKLRFSDWRCQCGKSESDCED